ncbi:MAG: ferrous iron transport protein A [Syntrophobacteraceae bacterium]|nr:ferrous iron transport protein A [Syntrophobacteraceae bacterium]
MQDKARFKCGCRCTSMKTSNNGMLPLCEAEAGKRLKVAGIEGGRGLCARMAAMGIYPGVEMEVLCGGCGCPCLVRVRGGTISLGKGVSDKILVTSAL